MIHRRSPDTQLGESDYDHRNNDDGRIPSVTCCPQDSRKDDTYQETADSNCNITAKNAHDVPEITSLGQAGINKKY